MDVTLAIEHWLSLGGAIGAILIGLYAALKGEREGAEKARRRPPETAARPALTTLVDRQACDQIALAVQDLATTTRAILAMLDAMARDLREAADRRERDSMRDEIRRLRDEIERRPAPG